MRIALVIIVFFVSVCKSWSLEENLLFKPLAANVFEPRIGAIYGGQDKKLRLDIGYSHDLKEFSPSKSTKLRIGADFFTYTRLRSAGSFKFPVETSDYFFGLNTTARSIVKDNEFLLRFRLAHISSHLVDGMAKDSIFTRNPFTYSREFIDLVSALKMQDLRYYTGITYNFSLLPDDAETIFYYLGFDYRKELSDIFDFVGGGDIKIFSMKPENMKSLSAQAGIKFKTWDTAGILLSLYYYDGKSIHGMFYREKDSYFGVGFQLIYY